mmetsp:Transcript_123809/g.350570  ORF Transcript_123809/g.350570 Transcript_123809/m.350570 type:complete len:169 (+) Transcript_123809:47-553(+)
MKPAWDQLMAEYEGSPSAVVADVDCTGEGKRICESNGVEGFPTIKQGDPNSLEDYEGGRGLEDLQQFAKDSLGPRCGPASVDACDPDAKKQLDEFMAMSDDEISKLIGEKDEALKKAGADMEALVGGLNKRYEEGQEKAAAEKKRIKDAGLGMMKSVLAHKKEQHDEF